MKKLVRLEDLPAREGRGGAAEMRSGRLCRAFHYTWEDMQDVVLPMAAKGTEPIVSMGADVPVAALSKTHPSLYDYFRQRFAQVTNPPIDALREEVKTDCSIYIGDDGNLLSREADNSTVLELPSPVLTEEELERIREMEPPDFSGAHGFPAL